MTSLENSLRVDCLDNRHLLSRKCEDGLHGITAMAELPVLAWQRSCCPPPAGQPSPSWSCARNACKLSMLREQDHFHAQSTTRPLPSGWMGAKGAGEGELCFLHLMDLLLLCLRWCLNRSSWECQTSWSQEWKLPYENRWKNIDQCSLKTIDRCSWKI